MGKRDETAGKWLSSTQAAEELGMTLRTIYRFMDEGTLPAYKFGRVIRVKAKDLEAFVEAHRIQPGTLSHLYPAVVQAAKGDEPDADGLVLIDPAGTRQADPAPSVTTS